MTPDFQLTNGQAHFTWDCENGSMLPEPCDPNVSSSPDLVGPPWAWHPQHESSRWQEADRAGALDWRDLRPRGEAEPLKYYKTKEWKQEGCKVNSAGTSHADVTVLPATTWWGDHFPSAVFYSQTHKTSRTTWKNTRQTQIEGHSTNYPTKHSSKLSRSWKIRKDRNCHRPRRPRRQDNRTQCDILDWSLEQRSSVEKLVKSE